MRVRVLLYAVALHCGTRYLIAVLARPTAQVPRWAGNVSGGPGSIPGRFWRTGVPSFRRCSTEPLHSGSVKYRDVVRPLHWPLHYQVRVEGAWEKKNKKKLQVIHANLSLLRTNNDSTEPFPRSRRKNAKTILTWNQYQTFFWVQTALRLTLNLWRKSISSAILDAYFYAWYSTRKGKKVTRKMQLRCWAYDTNDHVQQHRLAYNFCVRPRGMGDVFLEPHQLEIKNCFQKKTLKFGVEF